MALGLVAETRPICASSGRRANVWCQYEAGKSSSCASR